MKKNKSKITRVTLGCVGLLLSLLMMATFFMPVHKINIPIGMPTMYYLTIHLSGLELLQGEVSSEEDIAELTIQLIDGSIDNDTLVKKEIAYSLAQKKSIEHQITVWASVAIAIMGTIGLIFSILSLVRKGLGVGGIVTGALMTLFSLTFIITAFITSNTLNGITVNVAPWLALASSLLFLGTSIAGLILRRRSAKLEAK